MFKSILISICAVYCLSFLHVNDAFASKRCSTALSSLVSEVQLALPHSTIPTPESLPMIRKMLRIVDKIAKDIQKGNSVRSQIYREVLPKIKKLKALGEKISNSQAEDQNDVYKFAYQFSKLIDLPINFGNYLAYYVGGYNYMYQFSDTAFNKRLKAYQKNINENFKSALQAFLKEKSEDSLRDLNEGFYFIQINNITIPDMMTFPFQYKYIFKEGVIDIFDLFKDREKGIAYLGVSPIENAEYDGQLSSSSAFLAHDLRHAFTQKYYDFLLFKDFNASSLTEQIALKEVTNAMLQKRINEYRQIKNIYLRDMIEVLLFTLLHEQSLSYPHSVASELKKEDFHNFVIRTFKRYINEGLFGKKYLNLKGKDDLVEEALKWVQQRATLDAEQLSNTN